MNGRPRASAIALASMTPTMTPPMRPGPPVAATASSASSADAGLRRALARSARRDDRDGRGRRSRARRRRTGDARRAATARGWRGCAARRRSPPRPPSRRSWSRCPGPAWRRTLAGSAAAGNARAPTPASSLRRRRAPKTGCMASPVLRSARAAAPWRWRRPRSVQRGSAPRIPRSPADGAIEIVPIRTTGDRIAGPRRCRDRRQGPVHQGDRGGAARRRASTRGALAEGHADRAAGRADASPATCRARTRATRSIAAGARGASPSCRRARWSAPPRCGARRSSCTRGPISPIVPLRGNVDTRLPKLAAGAVAATVLAVAGPEAPRPQPMHRAGRSRPRRCCRRAGQGIIAVETRAGDARARGAARRRSTTTDRVLRRRRARAARRARRLVPHADRRARHRRRADGSRSTRMVIRPDGGDAPSRAARRRGSRRQRARRRCRRRAPVARRTGLLRSGRAGMKALVTRPREDAAALAAALAGARHRAGARAAAGDPLCRGRRRACWRRCSPARRRCSSPAPTACAPSPPLRRGAILPAFAVGDATAAAARGAGFGTVRERRRRCRGAGAPGRGGASRPRTARWSMPRRAIWRAIWRARSARRASGCAARVLYQAVPAARLSAQATALLAAGEIALALFFSPRTAACFVRLARAAGVAAACRTVAAVALSPAVAAALDGLAWRALRVAGTPDAPALAAAVERLVAEDPPSRPPRDRTHRHDGDAQGRGRRAARACDLARRHPARRSRSAGRRTRGAAGERGPPRPHANLGALGRRAAGGRASGGRERAVLGTAPAVGRPAGCRSDCGARGAGRRRRGRAQRRRGACRAGSRRR